MADWEPAPPSVQIAGAIQCLEIAINAMADHLARLRTLAADVAAMERRLAEYARKERADAE